MAANSEPVMARPSIPSSPAIAAAVVAWSPVIIRTWIPASWHSPMATLASGRGGSTMPTIARSVSSCTWSMSSPPEVSTLGSRSRCATTMTRSPAFAIWSLAAEARCRLSSVIGTRLPSGLRMVVARAMRTSGAPLT